MQAFGIGLFTSRFSEKMLLRVSITAMAFSYLMLVSYYPITLASSILVVSCFIVANLPVYRIPLLSAILCPYSHFF